MVPCGTFLLSAISACLLLRLMRAYETFGYWTVHLEKPNLVLLQSKLSILG